MSGLMKTFSNGTAVPTVEIPDYPLNDFLQGMIDEAGRGWRVLSYFAVKEQEGLQLFAILGSETKQLIGAMKSRLSGTLPSISRYLPQVHLFERELAENFGVTVEDHPWFKPVRYIHSSSGSADAWGRAADEPILPCVTDFYRVNGEEIHEVAVGPVHAGIIEPGHFRFQCHGEIVFHLEIALGYQHRGIETLVTGGSEPATIHRMETIAGDTTIGHAQAYSMAIEGLCGTAASDRGNSLRAVALELERLANHTGDLGALAGDVGYLPTMSYCGRIRGDFLNMTAVICGNRFGRGIVRPGGSAFDLQPKQIAELQRRLAAAASDLKNAVELLWHSSSVMARFEGTGIVTSEDSTELGLVGVAARAAGLQRDVRSGFPFGAYQRVSWQPQTDSHGDVYARAMVRWLESQRSIDFIASELDRLPKGNCRVQVDQPRPEMLAVALTEGWRGEICHTAITGKNGNFAAYKIVDPSFHNWTGLALALRGEQISDFPLCNKSFNLSYCGFDL